MARYFPPHTLPCRSFFMLLLSSSGFQYTIMLAAVEKGDVKELSELMKQDPGFDVNMDMNGYGHTLLHYACSEDRISAVIPLLLAHPGIDVNVKDDTRWTPFSYACQTGSAPSVREMLKDSRVKVNEPVEDGLFPSLGGTGSEWVFFAFVFFFLSSNKSPHEKKSQILTPHLLFLFFLPFNFFGID